MRYILTDTGKFIDLKKWLTADPFFFQTTNQVKYLKDVYGITVMKYFDKLDYDTVLDLLNDQDRYWKYSFELDGIEGHQHTYGDTEFKKVLTGFCKLAYVPHPSCDIEVEFEGNRYYLNYKLARDYYNIGFFKHVKQVNVMATEAFDELVPILKQNENKEFEIIDNQYTKMVFKRPEFLIKFKKLSSDEETVISGYEIVDVVYGNSTAIPWGHGDADLHGGLSGVKSLFSGSMSGRVDGHAHYESGATVTETVAIKYKRIDE